MSFKVLATITPHPAHRADVVTAIKELVRATRGEPGLVQFELLMGRERLFILEEWVDRQAWDRHVAVPISNELKEVITTKLKAAPLHERIG